MPALNSGLAQGDGYTIVERASLAGRNTFRVPARAELLIDVRKPAALAELFGYAALKTQPLLVLGEGSNVLFTRDWPGVVLSIAARGIAVPEDRGDAARVRVEAGENWNDFVRWSLAHGFAGLENLVLIPGTVGAAPIQNIGAYGIEVRQFIAAVEAWDRREARLVRLDNADCAFGYRDSRFKRERERYVVTAVEFELPRERALRLDYAGVREELAALGIDEPTPSNVAEAVARLRTRKLPDPAVIGNAGSFFKNPIVAAGLAERLRREHPQLQAWPTEDGGAKLSAAWLIESLGFKGAREGDAGVSERHALVLVNHGSASGAELWALAERIRGRVRECYDVVLEAEPLIV
ncbi:UDP-N-acetylmuramate dehydrogenase [Dokdonella sp.]|uniref:UDP-N-acetylmuramate dehydrogenase n=1 Tax=Dokdonella sp. TaxID=2291710 RepID=UPI001B08915D|nr:UDP-N-acetylmuramate dehydrogenase [Dokdonella sp.]MBO9662835.1 UDP-N-acetylmuramate dehydrogenase [Dokdonella sp.]